MSAETWAETFREAAAHIAMLDRDNADLRARLSEVEAERDDAAKNRDRTCGAPMSDTREGACAREEAKVARCCACRSEFTEAQINGVSACPACNNPGVPADPRKDVTIRINPHELRILTIWASNWAEEKCDASARRSLKGILGALREQLPDTPLTMLDEVKEIAAAGHDVKMIKGGEVVADLKGKKPQ